MIQDVTNYNLVPVKSSIEVSLMLAQLDQATEEWLGELGSDLTEAELRWQKFPNGHSIGALFVHIAEVEAYWLHHVCLGEPYQDIESTALNAEIDQYGGLWPTPPDHPLAYYLALLKATRAKTKALISAIPDPEHTASRKRQNGETQTVTLRWLLTHVILHEAYHGGQAVLLFLEQRQNQNK
jgi:uncharacterized damage-inducible protein DinB